MKKSIPATESKPLKASAAKEPIRILFLGTCPKLTARGGGDLSYELGIDENTGDSYVRISANASSGAYSNEWLALTNIPYPLGPQTGAALLVSINERPCSPDAPPTTMATSLLF